MSRPTLTDDALSAAEESGRVRHARTLAALAESDALAQADRPAFFQALTARLVDALDVQRVGVWCLDRAAARLTCECLWERGGGGASNSPDLIASEHPEYFAALRSGRPVGIADIHAEAAFWAAALGVEKVRAVLHAPIWLQGHLVGVVRYEHVAGPRSWTADEEQVARSVSDLISLLLEAEGSRSAETSLRGSEEGYRDLVETMEDVLYVVELDGRVTSLNQAFERHLGWKRDEWLGRHFAAFVHPDDLGAAAAIQKRVLAGESPVEVEMRFRHASGAWRVGEVRATARRSGGVITGVLGVARDVTDRSRSEARNRTLLGIARDVAGNLDLGGLFERMLGPTADSLGCDGAIVFREIADTGESRAQGDFGFDSEQSQHLRGLVFHRGFPFGGRLSRGETVVLARPQDAPPELVREVLAPLGVRSLVAAPLYATGHYYGALVGWSRREDGFDAAAVVQCEAIAQLLTGAVGAFELYRLKNEESELEVVQARIAEDMISSLEVPVLLERVCRATCELLPCDNATAFLYDEDTEEFFPAAISGQTTRPWDAIEAVRVPRFSIKDAVERLEEQGVVHVAASDEGVAGVMAVYGVSTGMMAALNQDSKLIGVLAMGRADPEASFDVADERRAHRIARLAALGLTNAQLVQQLEGANRLKSEFVATMSHELRTPLNVILGYSDLLLEEAFGPLTEDQQDTLSRLAQSAQNLCELVNATLDLSRLEAGRIPVDLSDVPVTRVLREVVEAQGELPAALAFRCEEAEHLGAIRTDFGKLKVALGNLLSNAFKFTEEGSVNLSASAERDGVVFEVRDTGPGIEPELQEVVFESFRQGDGSASRRHGGAGLGLYIVRQLVEVLSGTVSVKSVPGKGSAFRLWVPRLARSNKGEQRSVDVFRSSDEAGVSPEEKAVLARPR